MIAMDKNFNMSEKQLNLLAKMAKQKTGMDVNQMKQSVENGTLDNILGQMDPAAANQLKKVLTDKGAAQQLLNTPEAKELIKKLMGK